MYQAWYRKWRPAVFSDVVGQRHVTETLKNEVANNKTGHAYLFTGTRGTGKTTCAKILAKAVNCKNPKDGDPCNECEYCVGINNGSIFDVVEIDAASNNGVDNIRELREEAVYSPANCAKRVYILDEVHMLTPGAFNALLKTLEEPPSHILFILASTEVNKIPATILSRCQRFDFKRIAISDIEERLLHISREENIDIDNSAIRLIAELADGALRDAISILDQCAGTGQKVTEKKVLEMVGRTDIKKIFEISGAVLKGDIAAVLNIISELYHNSKKMDELISDLMRHYRNIMIIKTVKNPSAILGKREEELVELNEVSLKYNISEILFCINTLQDTLTRMTRTNDNRTEAEVCLIRLCNPKLSEGTAALSARIANLEATLSSRIQVKEDTDKPKKEKVSENKENPIEEKSVPKEGENREKAVRNMAKMHKNAPELPQNAPFWADVIQDLKQQKKAQLCGFLKDSEAKINGDELQVELQNQFSLEIFQKADNINILKNAVNSVAGKSYEIKLSVNGNNKKGNDIPILDDETAIIDKYGG